MSPGRKRFRRKKTILDTRTAMEKLIDKFWEDEITIRQKKDEKEFNV